MTMNPNRPGQPPARPPAVTTRYPYAMPPRMPARRSGFFNQPPGLMGGIGSGPTGPSLGGNGQGLEPSEPSESASRLDPNDFPALGATTYAQQAQAAAAAAAAATGSTLTQDDFPALGDAPPGLSGTPGLLNIGAGMLGGGSRFATLKPQHQPPHHSWNSSPNPPPLQAQTQNGNSHPPNPQQQAAPQPPPPQPAYPQTPAQQVLISAADRWGLLGLLLSIKNAGQDPDQGLSAVGTDLGTMGLDMGFEGNLYSTFITPWSDQSAARSVEPDFALPPCYNVNPPPPGPSKVTGFSDETLFFMFYTSPRDALQEVAAQELWNRNWRFHKTLRMWITKETGMVPSQKVRFFNVPGGETGQYHVWDAELWAKERRDMTVMYSELEEKNVPAFLGGGGLVPATQQVGVVG